MSPIAQLPSQPNKFDVFMEKFGWPTITLIVGTVLAAVIIAIWLGKIQIIDFSWIMLILGCIMFCILVSFLWYSFKARQKLQEKYQEDLASSRKEYRDAQDNFRDMTTQEFNRLNEGFINYSKENAKQQKEHSEELKRQCMEAIHDAELRLDATVKNSLSIFKTAQETTGIIIDQYRDQLIHAQNQMAALEERLRQELKPKDEEEST